MTNSAELIGETEWVARASRLRFETRAFIGGTWVAAHDNGATFETVNPATRERLAIFPSGTEKDVDRAVDVARQAFNRTWHRESPTNRKRTLLAIASGIEARAWEFALRDSLEMGKPIQHACAEAAMSVNFLRFYAESTDKVYGEVAPTDPCHSLTLTLRAPWGVVGAIVPWNFPLLSACLAIAPALAAGNTVLLKPSEVSPSSALLLGVVASEAGLPPGVLNVLPGLGPVVGAAMAEHRGIDKLHFTGSTAVGRTLLEAAGRSNGKSVMLEVGGKSPQIVFADALNLAGLAEALAGAAFFNTGQICVARTRLLVEVGILEDLANRVRAASRAFEPGRPFDAHTMCGPLASEAQLRRLQGFLEPFERTPWRESVRKAFEVGQLSTGYFVNPLVLTGVRPHMPIAQEEVFGPVLVVLPFKDTEEAIALANATEYGLAATVWTRDLDRAMRVAREVDAGRIEVRTTARPGAPLELYAAEPFRGSGFGPLGGLRGLEPYVRYKAIEILTA